MFDDESEACIKIGSIKVGNEIMYTCAKVILLVILKAKSDETSIFEHNRH